MTSKSGNSDLVISLDSKNKFPNKRYNNFISDQKFTDDSILIDPEMIRTFEDTKQKAGENVKVTGAYIGVYTNDESEASYSILISKKHEFTPILLMNGQIQSGSVDKNETKIYYFKTGSQRPVYA